MLLSIALHLALGMLVVRNVSAPPPELSARVSWEFDAPPESVFAAALSRDLPPIEEEAPPVEVLPAPPARAEAPADLDESPPKPQERSEAQPRRLDSPRSLNIAEMSAPLPRPHESEPAPAESKPAPSPLVPAPRPAPAPAPMPPPSRPGPAKTPVTVGPKPHVARNASPVYPRAAQRRGWQGQVRMKLLIDRQGRVKDIRLLKSSGYDLLDDAARSAVRAWTFDPARRGARAVEGWFSKTIEFRLR